jgi:hypothetical protein
MGNQKSQIQTEAAAPSFVAGTEIPKDKVTKSYLSKAQFLEKIAAQDLQDINVRVAYSKNTDWNGYFVRFELSGDELQLSSGDAKELGLLVEVGDNYAWGPSKLGVRRAPGKPAELYTA